MRLQRWLLTVLLSLLVSGAAGAAGPLHAAAADQTVTVLSTGEAHAQPDIALLTGGVEVSAASPREALQTAATQMQGIGAALQQLGIAASDIQTANISVVPMYGKPDQAGTVPEVTSYHASNTVSITLRDLSAIDRVLDTLLAAGSTVLQGVQFGLSDPAALHQQALADAVQRARPLAAAAAQAAGLSVGVVLSIEEVNTNPPLPAGAGIGGGSAVQGGTLTVRVQVNVRFAVVPPRVSVRLDPIAGSGVSGRVTLSDADGRTLVDLDVTGLMPGSIYSSQLHAGTCDQPSASFTDLPQLQADSTGAATASGPVRFRGVEGISLADLTDGDHVIVVRGPEGQPAACGSIPAVAGPPADQ